MKIKKKVGFVDYDGQEEGSGEGNHALGQVETEAAGHEGSAVKGDEEEDPEAHDRGEAGDECRHHRGQEQVAHAAG